MPKKSYSKLIKLSTFGDRFEYLKIGGKVGDHTFGGHRYLNQLLYQSNKWKSVRRKIILRDNGCDLSCEGYEIQGSIYIHHLNPITIDDILNERSCVFDVENLISCSFQTHNAIHYGAIEQLPKVMFVERSKNDTRLW